MKLSYIVKKLFVAIFLLFIATGIIIAQETDKVDENVKKDVSKEENVNLADTGWRVRDFRPYIQAIKELEKLNKEYSENLLKLAIDEYSTGLDILEDAESEILKLRKMNTNKKYLNERWYWQEVDRKNQQHRQIAMKKRQAKMKAVTYLTKSIYYLDDIQNPDVRRDAKFINFQSRLFQVYVSTQYDLQNFKPCIPILERYLTLRKQNKKDIWAYRYLASCYGYMEKVVGKYKHAGEDEVLHFKMKKNRNMLQVVELKYGVDSPHFKHLQEIVEQDEKKSEMINDYR